MLRNDVHRDGVLRALALYWARHPDWCLEQLINSAKADCCASFIDDDALIYALEDAAVKEICCGG